MVKDICERCGMENPSEICEACMKEIEEYMLQEDIKYDEAQRNATQE